MSISSVSSTGFFHPYAVAPLVTPEPHRLESLYQKVVKDLESLSNYKPKETEK
jgi:hypothetical protein